MAKKSIFELDLVRIAKWHRRSALVVWVLVFTWIGMILTSMNSIAVPEMISFLVTIVYLLSLVLGMVFVVILQHACGASAIELVFYSLLTLLLSFLMMIATLSRAGTILTLAGVKPGFVGIKGDDLDRLQPGHCRGCGYSREGIEILQACPECERVPQVI